VGLHELERSHYDCVWNLAAEIATPRQVGARNGHSLLSLRGARFLAYASKQASQSPARNREGTDSFTPQKVNRLTKTEAGHYIQVITTYLVSLEMIIATGSHHSSIIST
jgi:hypothetical protein